MNKPNRSRHEMLSDILGAIGTGGLTISGIQSKTDISYQHLKKYLTYLVQDELIFYRKEENRFRITLKGLHALEIYIKLDELLVRKTPNKVLEFISEFP